MCELLGLGEGRHGDCGGGRQLAQRLVQLRSAHSLPLRPHVTCRVAPLPQLLECTETRQLDHVCRDACALFLVEGLRAPHAPVVHPRARELRSRRRVAQRERERPRKVGRGLVLRRHQVRRRVVREQQVGPRVGDDELGGDGGVGGGGGDKAHGGVGEGCGERVGRREGGVCGGHLTLRLSPVLEQHGFVDGRRVVERAESPVNGRGVHEARTARSRSESDRAEHRDCCVREPFRRSARLVEGKDARGVRTTARQRALGN
mmetsp:Transcript_17227/g.44139  ORF Transcript_17227/g.44139 Transcript_17227/m.44139 type:complete len:260 (-) Transcript_17227:1138-1917(-)